MTLKRFIQLVIGSVAFMLFAVSALVWGLLDNQKALNDASSAQREAANMLSFYRMVNEVTVRLVRQYAVADDKNAKKEYDEVIDVLIGKRDWPTGKRRTVLEYMTELNFPARAFELRKKAIELAKPAYVAEDTAMYAMQGKFIDDNGEFTVNGAPDQQLAIAAVHSFEYQQSIEKLQPVYEELMTVVADHKQRQVDDLYQASVSKGYLVFIFSVLSIATLIFIYWLLNQRMVKPLQGMVNITEEMSQGDLSVQSIYSGKDEVGRLGSAFNVMVDSLNTLLERTNYTANSVSSAAEELAARVEEGDIQTKSQQIAIEEVSSAVADMHNSSLDVTQKCKTTSVATQQATQATEKGISVVNQTSDMITELAGSINAAGEKIVTLQDHANSVSGVINVIRDVAEQTNLLALNAAIEAARAGEQGRGFAVVADEVRSLASRTSNATTEINDTITQLMTGTKEAVGVVELSVKTASESVDQVKSAGAVLDTINDSVRDIDAMTDEISAATVYQTNTINNVNQLLEKISALSNKHLESSSHTSEASDNLGEMSQELKIHLQQFKLRV